MTRIKLPDKDLTKPVKQPKVKKPKTKNKGVAYYKKEADKWFSKYVRYRDAGWTTNGWYAECITCGVKKPIAQLQAGHFVSRRVNLLRYDELNVNSQCLGCNMFKAGEQYTYSINLDLKYGDGTAKKLHDQRNISHKLTIPELQQVIEDSKAQIAWYEKNASNNLD